MVLDSEPWGHGCRAMRALSMRRDYSFVAPAKRTQRDSCIEFMQHHKGWGLSLDLCSCSPCTYRKRCRKARHKLYTLPGSTWRLSACWADAIATRPHVMRGALPSNIKLRLPTHALRLVTTTTQHAKSGHPESNQGPSDYCVFLQSDALPAEL